MYQKLFSPNFDPTEITIQFLVLHYTATNLKKTLEIFKNPKALVSSHIVIDTDGTIYEVVPCLEGKCFKAWHSGNSHWKTKQKKWQQFNNFSMGVELVNNNGNLFKYTKQQYLALQVLLKKLKKLYVNLQNPKRILGHEHIAGDRGKVDPGYYFDWDLFFKMNYISSTKIVRKSILSKEQLKIFTQKITTDTDWQELNTQMENRLL